MSPEPRSAFALRGLRDAYRLHGVPVKFRGQDIRVILSPINIGFDLEAGGFKQSGQFRCRFLSETLQTPPAKDDRVLYHGRTYLLSEIAQNSGSEHEHVVTLTPGSLQ